MRYDFLREPVSETEPCGPDLEETFDSGYANVTANVSSLIPQRYYDRSKDKIFDRGTIDLPVQQAAITGLLNRSRDIRLLVLDARLQLLAGKLIGFSEALAGMVIVVTTFWDQFHPMPLDGDMIMRQNTLEGLDDLAVIVPALQFAPILEGRARISYRNYLVSFGTIEPWAAEEPMSRDTLDRALREEAAKEQLTAAHAAVLGCLDALATLRNTFIEKAGHVNAPAFDRVNEVLAGLRVFLEDYLGITAAAAQAAATELAIESGEATASGGGGGALRPAGAVVDHAAAMSALKAAEDYFVRIEPSSPALILIHQSRLLIGRPLVEALEALLPEPSARAVLRFDGGFKFDLDLARMKFVTDDMLANAAPAPEGYGAETTSESDESTDGYVAGDPNGDALEIAGEESEPAAAEDPAETEAPPAVARRPSGNGMDLSGAPSFSVSNRQEAAQLLSAVEGFFKLVEPSSPVALLLARARSYIGKDFTAILNELLPPLPIE